jgi:hypothetical protein
MPYAPQGIKGLDNDNDDDDYDVAQTTDKVNELM